MSQTDVKSATGSAAAWSTSATALRISPNSSHPAKPQRATRTRRAPRPSNDVEPGPKNRPPRRGLPAGFTPPVGDNPSACLDEEIRCLCRIAKHYAQLHGKTYHATVSDRGNE